MGGVLVSTADTSYVGSVYRQSDMGVRSGSVVRVHQDMEARRSPLSLRPCPILTVVHWCRCQQPDRYYWSRCFGDLARSAGYVLMVSPVNRTGAPVMHVDIEDGQCLR